MIYNMTTFKIFHLQPNFAASRAFFYQLATPQRGKVSFYNPHNIYFQKQKSDYVRS